MKILRNNTSKIVLFTILFSFFFGISHAQTDSNTQNSDFWNHVRFGGGIGLSFGNNYFSGTISPSALYDVNKNFSVGVGLNASFNNRKDYYKSTVLGGSLIALINPVKEVQISAEYERLNVNRSWDNFYDRADEKYWYPALFLGAGYRTGNMTFGIRYDVLYDRYKSIYSDAWIPFVRFYF